MRTRDKILLGLGLFIAGFIVCMIVTYWKFRSVPDTLIQYTLGAGGLEALLLAGITVSKIWKNDKEESEETDDV